MRASLLFFVCHFMVTVAFPQSVEKPDSLQQKGKLTLSGYVETYFLYDFHHQNESNLPGYFYSYSRNQEVNLNIGYLMASYEHDRTRANFGLMAGTYSRYNLAHEPPEFRNILEANVGVQLHKKQEIWLDAGVLPSHIGFEGVRGMDCLNLTRSMMAENSPYYLAGLRASFLSENKRWYASLSYLNGWQRMYRLAGNTTPAFGHQLMFTPNDRLTINSSSFVGSEYPDIQRRMRYFHNFYVDYSVLERLRFIVGFDYGMEQIAKRSDNFESWHSAIAIAQIRITEKFAFAGRYEQFIDHANIIISNHPFFEGKGYSFNLDYNISPSSIFRMELRNVQYTMARELFWVNFFPENYGSTFFVATSLTVSF
jgi:hypothetical protein